LSAVAKSFEKACTALDTARNEELKVAYGSKMTSYNEPLAATDPVFTAELLNRLLDQMKKNGKAAGLDNITCEHLKYTPCSIMKRNHFIFDYNSRILWFIFIIFVPLKTNINTS